MNATFTALLFFACLIAVVLLGRAVRRHLPEHHLSADSKDAVKLAMSLIATMTALLLGMLINSAKQSYDTQRNEVIQMAAKIAFLDRAFTLYGPEAAAARSRFHSAVAEAIRHMWPQEEDRPVEQRATVPGADETFFAIQQLTPGDDTHRNLKTQAATLATDLGQLRGLLVAQSVSSIANPLLVAMAFWLVILFLSFSLIAPPNGTTAVALVAAALSVAIAVFLILELDQPLDGLIRISSKPMHDALNLIGK